MDGLAGMVGGRFRVDGMGRAVWRGVVGVMGKAVWRGVEGDLVWHGAMLEWIAMCYRVVVFTKLQTFLQSIEVRTA